MIRKKVKLEWYVYIEDFNNRKFERYNILNEYFIEKLKKDVKPTKYKKGITCMEDLIEYLKSEFMYQYWSRAEYEMILSPWPKIRDENRNFEQKVDIYDQVRDNLEPMAIYINSKLNIF